MSVRIRSDVLYAKSDIGTYWIIWMVLVKLKQTFQS
jgi:hypothetical protein